MGILMEKSPPPPILGVPQGPPWSITSPGELRRSCQHVAATHVNYVRFLLANPLTFIPSSTDVMSRCDHMCEMDEQPFSIGLEGPGVRPAERSKPVGRSLNPCSLAELHPRNGRVATDWSGGVGLEATRPIISSL
jgi:hypothetical protein